MASTPGTSRAAPARARDAHASGPLVEALLRIPDREYASPASVAKELAKPM
ncbi:DUF2795 domain-containing protein [Burkholderia gladioli]|uniref:DUF2795 domain-containing protein n=1 Tax=Burkholderia gladioli TaxID=28095 RepID=UPI003F78FCA4